MNLKVFVEKILPRHTHASWIPVAMGLLCVIAGIGSFFYDFVGEAFAGHKVDYYGIVASSTASLLGFVITAGTILLSLQSEKHLKWTAASGLLTPMFNTFLRAMIASAAALSFSLLGLLLDRELSGSVFRFIEHITVVALAMALAYLSQTILILAEIAKVVLRNVEAAALEEIANEKDALDAKMGPPGEF